MMTCTFPSIHNKYLRTLTGLDKLYAEGEKALEDVDWDVEDEEEDF